MQPIRGIDKLFTLQITSLSVSGDHKKLTAVCIDGCAKVWDIVNRVHTNTFNVSSKPVSFLVTSFWQTLFLNTTNTQVPDEHSENLWSDC